MKYNKLNELLFSHQQHKQDPPIKVKKMTNDTTWEIVDVVYNNETRELEILIP